MLASWLNTMLGPLSPRTPPPEDGGVMMRHEETEIAVPPPNVTPIRKERRK